MHAFLIDYLTRGRPKAIVYDVLFTEPDVRRFDVGDQQWTGKESDDALAESIARAGNVILAADAAAEGLIDPSRAIAAPDESRPARAYGNAGSCIEERPLVVPPVASLDRAADYAALEHVNGLFIGHGDLFLSSGKPPGDPEVKALTARVLAATKEAGILSGVAVGTPGEAREHLAMGFSLVMVSNDTTLFGRAVAETARAARSGAKEE